MIAEEAVGDDRGDDARHDDRREGAHGERAEDLLEREEGAGERRVERGRDAGRGAGGHQDLGSLGVEAERAPE